MTRHGWMPCLMVVVSILAMVVPASAADTIDFGLIRSSDGKYFAEINGELQGVTDVRMQNRTTGDWIIFDVGDSEFDVESDEFDNLASLLADVGGTYSMQITHPAGVSVYTLYIGAALENMFPAMPDMTVPANIPQQYTFQWDWTGPADVKGIDYWCGDGGPEFWQLYYAADPEFAATSLNVDFGEFTGHGDFEIIYANLAGSDILSLTHSSGDELFGSNQLAYMASVDGADFNVVPEPATVSLLTLGGLALLRRRRSTRRRAA